MKLLSPLLAAGFLSAPLCAQSPAPIKLLSAGDPIPGTSQNLTSLDFNSQVRVSNTGDWIARLRLDGGDLSKDRAIVLNGSLLAQEGGPAPSPSGSTHIVLAACDLDDAGNPYYLAFVDGFPTSSAARSVLYRKDKLILTQLDNIQATGWSSASYYESILSFAVAADGMVLVVCRLVDPNVSTQTRSSLVRFKVDDFGNRFEETVLATKGEVLSGQSVGIDVVSNAQGAISVNPDGATTFNAKLEAAAGNEEDVIYTKSVLVAQSASPSPIPGRDFGSLLNASSNINSAGNVLAACELDSSDPSTDEVILLDGAVVARKGSPTPVSSLTYQSILDSCVYLDDSGEPYLMAQTTSGAKGLFTDNLILLRTGVTQVQGQQLSDLFLRRNTFHMSSDGDFAIFVGELDGNEEAVMLLERNIAEPYCSAEPNSTGNSAFLLASGSSDASENYVRITGSGLPPGQFSYLLAAESSADIPMAGGSQGRLCLGSPAARFVGDVQSASAGGTVAFTPDLAAVPLNPAVAVSAGETWFFQVWYRDVNPTPTSNFTRPLSIEFR